MKKTISKAALITCASLFLFAPVSCYLGGPFFGEPSYPGATIDGLVDELPPDEEGDKLDAITENPFIKTSEQNVSTFSVDADGTSYGYTRRAIQGGFTIRADSIRIEEFLNYFTFDYDAPENAAVAINAELGDCPWNAEHKMLRLGIKGKEIPQEQMPKANYVFLVDVSGSMDGPDRLDLLKTGLIHLVDNMNMDDRISIITYSGSVKKVLDSTPVRDKAKIQSAIKKLNAWGSTNGGEALKMAYEEALENFIEGGNNRIIMGTDGDFNVGVTDTDELLEMVENYAAQGIYMTICGFGRGNYNDAMMETVSNHGNGTYVYVDSENEMMKVFVHERSNMLSVANDCKTQVTFNPDYVAEYRLIGYENRVLNNEDFENDKVDAAEIGAGQTVTALYEIIPAEGCDDSMSPAKFSFRYKDKLNEESKLLELDVSSAVSNSENMKFANGIAAFGMILRDSAHKGSATLEMAKTLVTEGSVSFNDPYGYRRELISLIEKYKESLLKE